MKDLSNPKWIVFKGVLFLLLGTFAAVLLWFSQPTLRNALLITIAVWAFCRFYYFAFYVVGNYVDPDFKFGGLVSVAAHLIQRTKKTRQMS